MFLNLHPLTLAVSLVSAAYKPLDHAFKKHSTREITSSIIPSYLIGAGTYVTMRKLSPYAKDFITRFNLPISPQVQTVTATIIYLASPLIGYSLIQFGEWLSRKLC